MNAARTDRSSGGISRLAQVLEWLPRYDRRWLRGDVVAGIAVTALIVPKNLGYAGIGGVPLENGLYAAAAGAIIYALFCTSRQISTGPSSSLAAVAGGAVLANSLGGQEAAQLVAAITIATGVLFLLMALFKMGWIAQFLSKAQLADDRRAQRPASYAYGDAPVVGSENERRCRLRSIQAMACLAGDVSRSPVAQPRSERLLRKHPYRVLEAVAADLFSHCIDVDGLGSARRDVRVEHNERDGCACLDVEGVLSVGPRDPQEIRVVLVREPHRRRPRASISVRCGNGHVPTAVDQLSRRCCARGVGHRRRHHH